MQNRPTKLQKNALGLAALKGLWVFVKPYRLILVLAIFALVFTAGVSLSLPIALRYVIEQMSEDLGQLDFYFMVLAGVVICIAIGSSLRFFLVTYLGERVVFDMRRAVYHHVIDMSASFYEDLKTGEVISRLTTDTTLIQTLVGSSLSIALRNILIFAGAIVLMSFTSPALTGLVLLIVPVTLFPILTFGRKVRRYSKETQDLIAESAGLASETLYAIPTIQALTAENEARNAFDAALARAFQAAKKRINARALMTFFVISLVFLAVLGVFWIATKDVRSGAMSSATLIQFVIYAIMAASSVAALSEVWGEVQRAAGASERLLELLEAEDVIKDGAKPAKIKKGALAFQNVSFSYPSRGHEKSVKDLSFEIKSGESVAFVGLSGAGKSTIFRLILRFFDPESGAITLDGCDIKDMKRRDFREYISLVPQDVEILSASVFENIVMGRTDASRDMVYRAAKAAAAHEFILALPEGYETNVGERGVKLSGGQRQRIAIARAVLRDTPIMLLDEATSAIDSESEERIQTALETLFGERTTLVIAHRLATIRKVDRIFMMSQGQILTSGTHEELMKASDAYRRLVELQILT